MERFVNATAYLALDFISSH